MPSKLPPPPENFVLVTRNRWAEYAKALGSDDRDIYICGLLAGCRRGAVHYVEPRMYRGTIGTWPDGYWPE